MEKIGLKLAFVFVLCGLLSVAVFAQEGSGTETNDSETPPAESTVSDPPSTPAAASTTPAPSSKQPAVPAATPRRRPQQEAPQPVNFTVTFTDGGNKVDLKTIEKDKKLADLPKPEKDGFEFAGWWTEKDSGTKFTEDTPVTSDITLFAKWNQKTVDNAGSPDADNVTEPEKLKWLNLELPTLLLAAGILALVLLALAALNFIVICGIRKKIRADMKEQFNGIAKKQDEQDAILEKIGSRYTAVENMRIPSAQDTAQSAAQSAAQIERLQSEVKRLEDEKSYLKRVIAKIDEENHRLKEEKRSVEGIKSGSLDPVNVFNNWASNPSAPLPRAFYYIEGDMKIRASRELKESQNADSKWISNREGPQKYLFPNPNSFYQMTNISELYKMDPSKLKAKGQNRVKIIKPCDMTNNGFVEFTGELEIL